MTSKALWVMVVNEILDTSARLLYLYWSFNAQQLRFSLYCLFRLILENEISCILAPDKQWLQSNCINNSRSNLPPT